MYNNEYNTQIAQRLLENNEKLIRHQDEINAMADTSFTSHLEGMALRDQNVIGGSGYTEATVRDIGYAADKTEGAKGSGEPEPVVMTRKPRKSKNKVVVDGGAILGLAEIETDPRGDPTVKAPLVQDAPSSSKENTQTEVTVVTEMPAAKAVGGGKQLNKYRALVKEIMEKHKMKLPYAAKYIKEHNLYNKDA